MRTIKLMCVAFALLASIPPNPAWAGRGHGHHHHGHHNHGHHNQGHHHGHHHYRGGYGGIGLALGLGLLGYSLGSYSNRAPSYPPSYGYPPAGYAPGYGYAPSYAPPAPPGYGQQWLR
ncbi:MAG: hypothetical protein H0X43_12040 [Nitrosospira sp.]|nr:hypothetical protein [Nitrosospira sp.]